jgi:uncharacterized protein with PIN domain
MSTPLHGKFAPNYEWVSSCCPAHLTNVLLSLAHPIAFISCFSHPQEALLHVSRPLTNPYPKAKSVDRCLTARAPLSDCSCEVLGSHIGLEAVANMLNPNHSCLELHTIYWPGKFLSTQV